LHKTRTRNPAKQTAGEVTEAETSAAAAAAALCTDATTPAFFTTAPRHRDQEYALSLDILHHARCRSASTINTD